MDNKNQQDLRQRPPATPYGTVVVFLGGRFSRVSRSDIGIKVTLYLLQASLCFY
jgi:hypothetical protein